MEKIRIRRDKITPSFIEAYKKWWANIQESLNKEVSKETLERESNTVIEFVPKDLEEKLQMKQLEVVMTQLHTEFLKEFKWYAVDLKTFWNAYIHHPLGWSLIFNNDKNEGEHSELVRSYYENAFERISSYAINQNRL